MLRIAAQGRRGSIDLDLELSVPAGDCTALVGPSGAGKSSVLRIAAGLLRPDRGRVSCGEELWLDTAKEIELGPERRACALVFQDYALFPHMRAWQNVAYALARLPRSGRRARAEAILDRFGLLDLAECRPGELSGGERQRLALARALALEPRALLLDEPLSALDSLTRATAARELARTVRELGVPTVLVTHDFSQAAAIADRVAVIDRGRVIQAGTLAELAAAPRSHFAADFAGAVVLEGRAAPAAGGGSVVRLAGLGEVRSRDRGEGPVRISVFPWQIALHAVGTRDNGMGENRVQVVVESVTVLGARARVELGATQPLRAELPAADCERLGLVAGSTAVAAWSATDTRIVGCSGRSGEREVPKS